MTEQLATITTERIDDISLLLTQSEGIGIPELLDEYFKPHCNWEGLSLSWTTDVCLTYMVSEGDQRMNLVQPWVGRRLKIVQTCTGQDVCERSWSNDRLAIVLDALSDNQMWQQLETALTVPVRSADPPPSAAAAR
jgi:hypothetical protein